VPFTDLKPGENTFTLSGKKVIMGKGDSPFGYMYDRQYYVSTQALYNKLYVNEAYTLPLVNDKISKTFQEIPYNKPSNKGAPFLKYGLQHYTDPQDPHFGYHWMYWSILTTNGSMYVQFEGIFNKQSSYWTREGTAANFSPTYVESNYPNTEATFSIVSGCTGYYSGYAYNSGYQNCSTREEIQIINGEPVNVTVNYCEPAFRSGISTGIITGTNITDGRWVTTGCKTGVNASKYNLDMFNNTYETPFGNSPRNLGSFEFDGYINKTWRTRFDADFEAKTPYGTYTLKKRVPINVMIYVDEYWAGTTLP
jgi:hypothetical protein